MGCLVLARVLGVDFEGVSVVILGFRLAFLFLVTREDMIAVF